MVSIGGFDSDRSFERLLEKLRQLQRRMRKIMDEFERLHTDMILFEEELADALHRRKSGDAAPDPALIPATFVHRVDMQKNGNRRFKIYFDSYAPFELTRSQALILDILSGDFGRPDGDLVGWKTTEEIIRIFEKHSGRRLTTASLNQAIHRLRNVLRENGRFRPELIQRDRRLGIRLARKRDS